MKTIIIIIFFVNHFMSYGQNLKFESKLTHKKKHIEINYCGENNSFILNIPGRKIEEVLSDDPRNNNQHIFSVNGRIIQVTIIPINQNFYELKKDDVNNLEKQKIVLANYMNYELQYYAKSLGPLKVRYMNKIVNNNNCLIWKFRYPEDKTKVDSKYDKNIRGNISLSRVCIDHILTLNIPLLENQSEINAKRKLNKIAKTIRVFKTQCLTE